MIRPLRAALLLLSLSVSPALAQTGALSPIQALLQEHREAIEKSSRRTIQPAIDAIRDSGLDAAPLVLEQWGARNMWQREDDGLLQGLQQCAPLPRATTSRTDPAAPSAGRACHTTRPRREQRHR